MFKKITEDAKLPTKATKFSAGVDVYANEDVTICAGETAIVGLGIAIEFNQDIKQSVNDWQKFLKSHYISLKPRSSLRAKGLISHSGVVDLDYKDELKMIIHNPVVGVYSIPIVSDDKSIIGEDYVVEGYGYEVDGEYHIRKGQRIGQLLLMEHKSYLFGIESEEERTGGLGSTGDK